MWRPIFFMNIGSTHDPIGFTRIPEAATHLQWSPEMFVCILLNKWATTCDFQQCGILLLFIYYLLLDFISREWHI